MAFARAAGLLLHPTSLPGPGGIGSIGQAARRFVDTLVESGMRHWQVLPLGPTGFGNSPYAALSAFAGNPLLIDLEPLVETHQSRTATADSFPISGERIDFANVIPARRAALQCAFQSQTGATDDSALQAFVAAHGAWLEDFALYMALKESHGGRPWNEWDEPLRRRDPDAVAAARTELEEELRFHRFLQFLFFSQWSVLKTYANRRGVLIVGDIPIFVAYDSADVWANQHLFKLDARGLPQVVAGVPPDYFSATGQLWGNPHYRWEAMEEDAFTWWTARFRVLLQLVDVIRLDHFRGFAAAWAVPFGDQTAERGEWVPTPGRRLFAEVQQHLGSLPIIAENLGLITPDVDELLKDLSFPGMHVLQFAFGNGASHPSLPHNLQRNSVVYTGTHDNDTTVGWFAQLDSAERHRVLRYTGSRGSDVSWDLIRLAIASVADLAIVPLQDVLRLGSYARMNYPGRPEGNWTWRFTERSLTDAHVDRLQKLNETFGRDGTRDVLEVAAR